jgi:hypothetical protein
MKTKKKRNKYYEPKLAIDATFGQVIRIAVGKKDEVAKELAQNKKGKK